MTTDSMIRRAAKLYRNFQGRNATKVDIVDIEAPEPEVALVMGHLHGVSYKKKSDGKLYFHKFKASNRPLLVVSSDGRQLYILKGGYKVTERGIVG